MTTTPKDPVDAQPREQFEKWARKRGHDTHRSSGDGYLVYSVQVMWTAFQAGRDLEASARALAAVPAPPLTMTGYQLREALEFLAPDGTAEQFEQEVCIQHGPERVCDAGTPDETTDPAGLYCWLSDCPEEGSIALTGEDARIRLETEPIAQQAGGVPAGRKLIGWRTSDYLMETDDAAKAKSWANHLDILPIFEGDENTKLVAPSPSAVQPLSEAQPKGRMHACDDPLCAVCGHGIVTPKEPT